MGCEDDSYREPSNEGHAVRSSGPLDDSMGSLASGGEKEAGPTTVAGPVQTPPESSSGTAGTPAASAPAHVPMVGFMVPLDIAPQVQRFIEELLANRNREAHER